MPDGKSKTSSRMSMLVPFLGYAKDVLATVCPHFSAHILTKLVDDDGLQAFPETPDTTSLPQVIGPSADARRSLRAASLRPGVVLLMPPWARSGSSHVFRAQVEAYAKMGCDTYVLLGPVDEWHGAYHKAFWSDVMPFFAFGKNQVGHVWNFDRIQIATYSYFSWLRNGRDTTLKIRARFAATGILPASFYDFIATHRIETVHVNHVYQMLLGKRVARLARRNCGGQPGILLDTHDVQSDNQYAQSHVNEFTKVMDPYEALLRDELSLMAEADELLHCCAGDLNFFTGLMPQARHSLLIPTLAPDIESGLTAARHVPSQPVADLLYIGNNHMGNCATVKWLLQEVVPQLDGVSLQIVGKIDDMFKRTEPDLFAKHQALFTGEVPSAIEWYQKARVILSPARDSTGTSMKTFEALCSGRPMVTDSGGRRGILEDMSQVVGFFQGDGPSAFVASVKQALEFAQASADGALKTTTAEHYDAVYGMRRFALNLTEIALGLRQRKASGWSSLPKDWPVLAAADLAGWPASSPLNAPSNRIELAAMRAAVQPATGSSVPSASLMPTQPLIQASGRS